MSVDLRKKTWTIIFRPFGPQIMLALRGCDSKRQAKAIEAELLYALYWFSGKWTGDSFS